ncbi:MAG TPA: YrdB family protein [Gaiellaceae bacterium]|nr:YrdB family protein [Gaiellaceae bacterium]
MRNAALTVRFLCEIAAVVAFVWHGWPLEGVAVGAAVIVFWGVFVAPKAPRRLADPLRLVSELVIFGGAAVAYVEVGQTVLAVVFGVLALATALLVRRWPEPV